MYIMRRLFSSIFTKTIIPFENGVKIARYVAAPQNVAKPLSYVGILHGYIEHIGYYEELAATLTQQGFCVFGYDRKGCGHSTGERGLVGDAKSGIEDFIQIKKTVSEDKVHVVGNSYGGCLALDVAIKYPNMVRSIVTINPALGINEKLLPKNSVKVRLLMKILDTFLVKYVNVGKYNTDNVTTNKRIIKTVLNDPLVYKGPFKGRSAKAMMDLQNDVISNMKSLKVPWLLELSAEDICVDPDLSRKEFVGCALRDKRIHETNGGHDIMLAFEEPRYQQTIQSICSWLHSHI
jgi:alpha-beta hydrolase superfamily lysophospholipase